VREKKILEKILGMASKRRLRQSEAATEKVGKRKN
jgi:hypothetical protein